MSTIENIKYYFDILASIAVTAASFFAMYKVNEWRRESVWKRKSKITIKTRVAFFEISDCINSIRNPFNYVGEGETRKKSSNETSSETELLNRAYVIIERFEKQKKLFMNLKKLEYKFIAEFNSEKAKPFKDINKLMTEILYASQMLGRKYWQEQGKVEMNEQEKRKHLKEMHDFENKIWWTSETDEVNLKLKEIIQTMEDNCKEFIRKK